MEITKLQSIKNTIKAMAESITPLVKNETDKFINIAQNFIEQAPKLQDCSTASICSAVMKAAQLNLFIDGQECSIVPFKGSAVLMTGYKGILKLVRNSGELSSINAYVVYEKDMFDFFVDEKGEHIHHKPVFSSDRGKPIHTYCIARTKGNPDPYIELMTEEEIDKCKKSSSAVKGGFDTPWNGPFADEMRKKTVIRRISKRLPMSTDMQIAISSDDALFTQQDDDKEEQEQKEVKTQSSRLESTILSNDKQPEKNPVPEVQKAEEKQKIEDLKQTFSQEVHGEISSIGGKIYEKDGNKKTRYSCKIADKFYGTWDKGFYTTIENAYNKKAPILVKFVVKLNSQKQEFNEIVSVEEVVASEESPI